MPTRNKNKKGKKVNKSKKKIIQNYSKKVKQTQKCYVQNRCIESNEPDYQTIYNQYFFVVKGCQYNTFITIIDSIYKLDELNFIKNYNNIIKTIQISLRAFFKKEKINSKQMTNWAWKTLIEGYFNLDCNDNSKYYNLYYSNIIGYSLAWCSVNEFSNKILEAILYYFCENNSNFLNIESKSYITNNIKYSNKHDSNNLCTKCLFQLMESIFKKYNGIGLNVNIHLQLCGIIPIEYVLNYYSINKHNALGNWIQFLINNGALPSINIHKYIHTNDIILQQNLINIIKSSKVNHYPIKSKYDLIKYCLNNNNSKSNYNSINSSQLILKIIFDFCGKSINNVSNLNKWHQTFNLTSF